MRHVVVLCAAVGLLVPFQLRAEEARVAPTDGLEYSLRADIKNTIGTDITESVLVTDRKVIASDGQTSKILYENHTISEKKNGAEQIPRNNFVTGSNSFVEYRYFLPVKFSFEYASQANDSSNARHVNVSTTECDQAMLASFFPLGRMTRVILPCARTGSLDGAAGKRNEFDMVLSYEGLSDVETSAGKFRVHHIRLSETVADRKSETLILFDDSHGIAVVGTTDIQAPGLSSHSHYEVTKISK